MTKRWQDGFDWMAHAADLSFRYNIQSASISTNGGRWGGGVVILAQNSGYIQTPLVTTPGEIWAGYSFYSNDTPGTNTEFAVCQFVSPQGIECTITYNALTLVFSLWEKSASTTLLGTSSPIILTVGTWHYIDIHFKLSTTTSGIVEIWIDNVRVMNVTGIITSYQGSATTLSNFINGATTGSFGSLAHAIDDLIINDTAGSRNNGRVGDSRVTIQVPNSDASPNNGTPTSGSSHFAMVDEAQWSSDDTLTLANTTGQEENFGVTPLTILPLTVFGVQVIAICEKTDGGVANAKLGVTSGGDDALSASQGLPISWGYLSGIFEADPNGNIDWNQTSLNAADINFTVQ